ncbi:MAG TPA: homoprotocatechuate degradation operon regulator HpaR [Paracoccaceae bacterium]|nr:homoprotocatechuate degradation operon regulator HpaR [Paracoccaceae bacterium]
MVTEPLSMELLRAREKLMRLVRPYLHEHHCTEQQWRVFRALDEFGELEPKDISEQSVIMPSSLTRILAILEKEGYVIRKKNPADGRSVLISLSEKGQSKVARMRPHVTEIHENFVKRYGRERVRYLAELLRAL